MIETDSSNPGVRRFLLKMLLPLLSIVLFVSIVFTTVFEKYIIFNNAYTGVYKVNRIIKENDSTETPIFGNSHAYCGIIPDSVGKNFFDYSIQGVGQDVLNFFLTEECRKRRISPLIVSDLNPRGFGTASEMYVSYYIPNAENPGVKKILGNDFRARFRIPIVKYFGEFEGYFRDFINLKRQKDHRNKGSVFSERLPVNDFKERIEERIKNPESFMLNKEIEDEFFSILSKNPGRLFVFVIVPVHKSFFNSYRNYGEFDQFITRLNTITNVKVFNFFKTSYPDSLFFDSSHLDYYGAIRFSKELKDSLATLKIPAITNSLRINNKLSVP